MRKLNELLRALSTFLADPALHVTEAWNVVKASIDPKYLRGNDPTFKNAFTTIDSAVTAVVYYLELKGDDPKRPEATQTNQVTIDVQGDVTGLTSEKGAAS